MPDYTPAIDAQISEQLRLRGSVSASSIPGLSDAEGATFLQRYLEIHGREVPLRIEDGALRFDTPPQSPAVGVGPGPVGAQGRESAAVLSPVDQVLAQPKGRSLLDSQATGGRVNKALWMLPFALGFMGGLIAWAVARGDSERTARQMLVAGIVLSVVWGCIGMAMGPVLATLSPTQSQFLAGTSWPASASGRPSYYYFGTAT